MGAHGKKLGKIATSQISLKLNETVLIRSTKHRTKYYAAAVSRLASRGQTGFQITQAPMGKLGKIATSQISVKLSEAVFIRSTKHRTKHYARAGSRLASRGQIDIHII